MYLCHAQLCSTFRQGDRTFGTDTAPEVLQYWERRKVSLQFLCRVIDFSWLLGHVIARYSSLRISALVSGSIRFGLSSVASGVWSVKVLLPASDVPSSGLYLKVPSAYVSVSIFELGSYHFESPMSSKSWVFFLMSTAEFVTRVLQRLGPSG